MVQLLYGRQVLDVSIPSSNITVIKSKNLPGLENERQSFFESIESPVKSKSLSDIIQDGQRVAIIIPDGTRPLPFKRLLSWVFEILNKKHRIEPIIVVGTGSHRQNTRDELIQMMGLEIIEKYPIVNHNAYEPTTMCQVGQRAGGRPVLMNREAVEADIRIALGFIEPHFMAGFSGGYKAIMPAITDIDTIMSYHTAEVIANPSSTWGILEGNPTQQTIRELGALLPIHFLVNVTLNFNRDITAYYCGDPIIAHQQGCAVVKRHTMRKVKRRYPIVITTNNGFPLDQNLYQSVKGMTAACGVVTQGGLIIQSSRCNDGYPDHGNFKRLLHDYASPQDLLQAIQSPGFSMLDQWQAQLFAKVLCHARVGLYSELTEKETRQAFLLPVHDIQNAVINELDRIGREAPIAVLPEGFMVIPYVEE